MKKQGYPRGESPQSPGHTLSLLEIMLDFAAILHIRRRCIIGV